MNRATLRLQLLLLGTVLCYLTPLSAHGQHYQPAGTRSAFVTTADGVRIHYLEAGPRSPAAKAPAILFVPGWTMPAEIWEAQIKYFAKTHRVVAMDPRSQGLSSQTSEGNYPEARARDIKAVVDQLKLAPAVLVGWSMGVSDVTAYVDQFGTHTVAGLVFVDGLTDFEPATRVILDMAASLQKDRSAATSDFVRGMYKKAQSEEYLRRITRASLRTPTNTALALLLSLISMERSPALAKINKPVLIVGAAGPFTKNHEETQRRISGSQLKILDGVGHALFVDEVDKFNTLLEEFLKRL